MTKANQCQEELARDIRKNQEKTTGSNYSLLSLVKSHPNAKKCTRIKLIQWRFNFAEMRVTCHIYVQLFLTKSQKVVQIGFHGLHSRFLWLVKFSLLRL